MPEEPNATPAANPATTPDAAVNNTAAPHPGPGTQPAQPEAQPEKTFTQAEVNAMIAQRLPKAVKAELKKMSGEDEGKPNVEDLQRQLSERDAKLRSYEARQSVNDYLTDARHKLNVKPENVRPIQELVIGRLEYDDDGKPSNMKEAIEEVKSLAPALFANTPGSIDANAGRNGQEVVGADMNSFIRRSAGIGQ